MRRLRRFSTVLVGLLLLQVIFTGVAAACALPDARTHETVPAHAGHGEHEHASSTTPPVPHHDEQAAHCPAAMTCAQSVVATVDTTVDCRVVPVVTVIVARNAETPASIAGTPETPPPRV